MVNKETGLIYNGKQNGRKSSKAIFCKTALLPNSTTFLHKELLFGAGNDRLSHSFIPDQYFEKNTRDDVHYCLKCKSRV